MKKYIVFAVVLVAFCSGASAQKVGGKVKVYDKTWTKWYDATLLSIKKVELTQ